MILKYANRIISTIDNHWRASCGYEQWVDVSGKQGAIGTASNYPDERDLSQRSSGLKRGAVGL